MSLLLTLQPTARARQCPAVPYELNAILPLTGCGAFFGKGIATSFTLLESVVNRSGGIRGRPIKISVLDDQSSPQVAVQLLSELMARKVPVVLGSGVAGNCNAMAAIAKDGPVTYCFSPAVLPPPGRQPTKTSTNSSLPRTSPAASIWRRPTSAPPRRSPV